MIKFEHVRKSFRGLIVLEDIDFVIEEGSLVRISGINGCGKSTLLKIATHLLDSKGTITYEHYEDQIGALIENPCFIESESALYNLKFLYNLKNKYDETKVTQLLRYFQLDPTSKIPIKKYSVGMRQKVGIIQAIMEGQKIIYLDEPTRGLDERSVDLFYELIEQLHKEGKTIVICSHEPLEKLSFDKELIMSEGKIHEKV